MVTQDDLLTKVWGPAYRDEAHLLRVNIARLRQKVEPEPSQPALRHHPPRHRLQPGQATTALSHRLNYASTKSQVLVTHP